MVQVEESDWALISHILSLSEAEWAAWQEFTATRPNAPDRGQKRDASAAADRELRVACRTWAELQRQRKETKADEPRHTPAAG